MKLNTDKKNQRGIYLLRCNSAFLYRKHCQVLRLLLKVIVNIIHDTDLVIVVLSETTEFTHVGCDRLHFDEALDP